MDVQQRTFRDSRGIPAELLNKDIKRIYKADSIIAANLQKHYTIEELPVCRAPIN